ncbi:MAG: helix-turn-helix domain-containing protein [Lactobacillus sp.]|jgi:Rgg/GadR/MutR family transcriptional activator|uniref:Helix-turn-helix domain-containing protein n=1 Tax=Lacticaseibacillus suilingensis TaxID=2799577 RepID=A0ABW4BG32_9LACO|nr:Rgg/GadR/MutR family transcriptional regulator [Lacticaseibacillus suilingensis]MCI1893878.1 helix-turn-helix domain-containing protein [Lactobacillus sp.]MCI1917422.1 helix-turn-helix domain-containing protein [Lactobacillus sp.]MCI1941962.1 helix-turn-helix domain-containing protein [Lactobacillus sp.]MCI1972899.1 helix-turn-helix domain-containing protein [Lactobacillus sp.]MCI2016672.1 helix-turn-helix domain-containing protein [Lactobacillus sp.]
MTNYGQIYRQLRQSKGITLDAVAAETGLTSSFISRFERGKSTVSLPNFEALLTAINLAHPEFWYHAQHADLPVGLSADAAKMVLVQRQLPFLAPFLKQTDYSSENVTELTQARDEALAAYRAVSTRNRHFSYLFYQGLLTLVEHPDQPVPNRWSLPVTQYLQQVDSWGVYEVQLFKLFMPMMPTPVNLQLLRMAVKLTKQLQATPVYETMLFDLLFGDFSAQLAAHELTAAKQILTLLDEATLNNLEPLVRRFAHGWLAIVAGRRAEGHATCQAAIDLMQAVEQPAMAQLWQKRLQYFLADEKNTMVFISL